MASVAECCPNLHEHARIDPCFRLLALREVEIALHVLHSDRHVASAKRGTDVTVHCPLCAREDVPGVLMLHLQQFQLMAGLLRPCWMCSTRSRTETRLVKPPLSSCVVQRPR